MLPGRFFVCAPITFLGLLFGDFMNLLKQQVILKDASALFLTNSPTCHSHTQQD